MQLPGKKYKKSRPTQRFMNGINDDVKEAVVIVEDSSDRAS